MNDQDRTAAQPEQPQAFGQHLIEIHNHFRRSLAELRTAAERLENGEANGADQAGGADLSLRSGKLQEHCLFFCHSLHGHHTVEDRHMFPGLRQAVPSLAPVLDRLQSEHQAVAVYIEKIEGVANSLADADRATFSTLRERLAQLSDDLLAHLDYEEEQLVSVLDGLTST